MLGIVAVHTGHLRTIIRGSQAIWVATGVAGPAVSCHLRRIKVFTAAVRWTYGDTGDIVDRST